MKKLAQFFQVSTDPFPSSPCEATNDRKQFQCLNVVVMPTPSFLTSESYSISSLQSLRLKIGEHRNPGLLNVISTRPLTLHNFSTTDYLNVGIVFNFLPAKPPVKNRGTSKPRTTQCNQHPTSHVT